MHTGDYVLLIVVLGGHVAMWIALFNRTHAFNVPRRWVRVSELSQILSAIGLLLYFVWRFHEGTRQDPSIRIWDLATTWEAIYAAICCGFGIWVAGHWIYRQLCVRWPTQLLSNDTEVIDVAGQIEIRYRDRPMRWSEIAPLLTAPAAPAPPRSALPTMPKTRSRRRGPSADHPWQQHGLTQRREYVQFARERRAWDRQQP